MSILQKFEPRKRTPDVKRSAPLAHSMEEFFEDFPPRRWMQTLEPYGWRWPAGADFEKSFRLDVIDRDKALLIRGELPGVEKDDIEVTIAGDRIVIEAERKFEEEDEKDSFYRHEVGFGKLMRTIGLPVEVDADKATAELRDGLLEIRLPKIKTSKRHTVKVV